MRQQLPDPTLWLSRQAGEDILQVGVGLMSIQARRLDQAHDRRCALAGAQRTRKEPVLAADGNRPDLVLDPVVIDGGVSIRQVMGQRRPALERVVDGLGAG